MADDELDDLDDADSWRAYTGFAVVFGVIAFAWQAVQGRYAVGLALFVSIVLVGPPMAWLRAWGLRLRRRTAERGAAWARRNPAASRRLRWVVFPVIGLIWVAVLVGLFA